MRLKCFQSATSHVISRHLTSSHVISRHLTSSHVISRHLTCTTPQLTCTTPQLTSLHMTPLPSPPPCTPGQTTENFLKKVSNLLLKHVTSNFDNRKKVLDADWSCEEVRQRIDLILEISDESESLESLLMDWEWLMKSCLRIGELRSWWTVDCMHPSML